MCLRSFITCDHLCCNCKIKLLFESKSEFGDRQNLETKCPACDIAANVISTISFDHLHVCFIFHFIYLFIFQQKKQKIKKKTKNRKLTKYTHLLKIRITNQSIYFQFLFLPSIKSNIIFCLLSQFNSSLSLSSLSLPWWK